MAAHLGLKMMLGLKSLFLRSPIFLPLYKRKEREQNIENFYVQENSIFLKGKKHIFINPPHTVSPQY